MHVNMYSKFQHACPYKVQVNTQKNAFHVTVHSKSNMHVKEKSHVNTQPLFLMNWLAPSPLPLQSVAPYSAHNGPVAPIDRVFRACRHDEDGGVVRGNTYADRPGSVPNNEQVPPHRPRGTGRGP